MTDPRNTTGSFPLSGLYPKSEIPVHGGPLKPVEVQQAEHLAAAIDMTDKFDHPTITDNQISAFIAESDDPISMITESIGEGSLCPPGSAARAEVELRIVHILTAFYERDDAEIGRIVRNAIRLYVLPMVAQAEREMDGD
jgi:hypothetical protein